MSTAFGDRLRSLRKKLGMKQQDLADAAGVSKASVSLWEQGAIPREDKRPRIAEILATTEDYLFKDSPAPALEPGEALVTRGDSSFNVVKSITSDEPQQLRLSRATFAECEVDMGDAVFMVLRDSSMHPVLEDGAYVVADTSDTKIRNGELYIVKYNETPRVAYLYTQVSGSLRVRFANNTEFPEELFTGNPPTIVGRVFWNAMMRPKKS